MWSRGQKVAVMSSQTYDQHTANATCAAALSQQACSSQNDRAEWHQIGRVSHRSVFLASTPRQFPAPPSYSPRLGIKPAPINPRNSAMNPNHTGLFPLDAATGGDNEIETAIREMFAELDSQGVLGPIERAKRAAAIKAARALDGDYRSGKLSVASSNTLKQITEILDSLPRPSAGTDMALDAYTVAVTALTQKAFVQ